MEHGVIIVHFSEKIMVEVEEMFLTAENEIPFRKRNGLICIPFSRKVQTYTILFLISISIWGEWYVLTNIIFYLSREDISNFVPAHFRHSTYCLLLGIM